MDLFSVLFSFLSPNRVSLHSTRLSYFLSFSVALQTLDPQQFFRIIFLFFNFCKRHTGVYASIFTDFPAKFHCQEDEEESFQLDTWSKEGTAAIAHIRRQLFACRLCNLWHLPTNIPPCIYLSRKDLNWGKNPLFTPNIRLAAHGTVETRNRGRYSVVLQNTVCISKLVMNTDRNCETMNENNGVDPWISFCIILSQYIKLRQLRSFT